MEQPMPQPMIQPMLEPMLEPMLQPMQQPMLQPMQQPMNYQYTSLTSLTPGKVNMTNFKTAIINAIARNNYSGSFSPEWKKSTPEQKEELIKEVLYDVANNTPRLSTLGLGRSVNTMANTLVSNVKGAGNYVKGAGNYFFGKRSPTTAQAAGGGRKHKGRKTHKKHKGRKTHKKHKARKMRKTKSKH
jgi:hypothetical protein